MFQKRHKVSKLSSFSYESYVAISRIKMYDFVQKVQSFNYAGWINSGDPIYSIVTTINAVLYIWNLLRKQALNEFMNAEGNYKRWWIC
jgi:hypothetical protein